MADGQLEGITKDWDPATGVATVSCREVKDIRELRNWARKRRNVAEHVMDGDAFGYLMSFNWWFQYTTPHWWTWYKMMNRLLFHWISSLYVLMDWNVDLARSSDLASKVEKSDPPKWETEQKYEKPHEKKREKWWKDRWKEVCYCFKWAVSRTTGWSVFGAWNWLTREGLPPAATSDHDESEVVVYAGHFHGSFWSSFSCFWP